MRTRLPLERRFPPLQRPGEVTIVLDSHLVDISCGADRTCSDAQTNIPYFIAPTKLTSVLDSHLVLIAWRSSTTECTCSDTQTLLRPPQRLDEVDDCVLDSHHVLIFCHASTTACACSDVQTLLGPLQRPHEIDHRARLTPPTSPSPSLSSPAYASMT